METWLTTIKTASLLGISDRAVRKQISNKKLKVKLDKTTGGYLVALSSLPPAAQRKYYREIQKEVAAQSTEVQPDIQPSTPTDDGLIDWAALERGWDKKMVDEVSTRLRLVREALAIERSGIDVTSRKAEMASRNNVELATLYRWIKSYNTHGEVGLLRKNVRDELAKPARPLVDREVRSFGPAALDYLTALYLVENKVKRCWVYKETVKEAERRLQGPVSDEEREAWRVGSYPSACRYLDSLAQYIVDYGREGVDFFRKKHLPKVLMAWEELLVNEVWVGDHNWADVFVEYMGKPIRPWLTTWIDAKSRVITGFTISDQNCSITIGLAMRHAALPKKDSPICGLPTEVYIDNGKDYQAKYLVGGTEYTWKYDYTSEVDGLFPRLGISVRHALEYRSWSKGIKERWYRTLKNKFHRQLPGWCGESQDERPDGFNEKKLCKEGKLLTMERYVALVIEAINEYNNAVHSTLKDTPLNVYRNTEKARQGTPSPEVFDFLLMPAKKRTLQSVGIRFAGKYYTHPALAFYENGQEVEVRFDPTDLSQIRIFIGKDYICTANANKQRFGDDEAASRHAEHQRHFERSVRNTVNGYMERAGFKKGRYTGQNIEDSAGDMITGYERAVRDMNNDQIEINTPPEQQAVGDEQLPLRIRKMLEVGRKALGMG